MSEWTKENLKTIHTKVLLNVLRAHRASESRIQNIIHECETEKEKQYRDVFLILKKQHEADQNPTTQDGWDEVSIIEAYQLGGSQFDRSTITVAELKAELATREHIPNKQEAKAIRQAKALANKNKGRKDK